MTDFSAEAPPQIGEIVQANERAPHWYRCLVIVDEVRSWGIQGFTTIPHREGPGDAYIRLQWDEIDQTGGHSRFITGEMKDAIDRARGADPNVVPAAPQHASTEPPSGEAAEPS